MRSGFQEREFGDADVGAAVRNEGEVFEWFGGLGFERGDFGGPAVFEFPGGQPAALGFGDDAGAFGREGFLAHGWFGELDAVGGLSFIEQQSVIPGGGGADFEVAMGKFAVGLVRIHAVPGFLQFEGIEQRTTFQGDGLVVMPRRRGLHWPVEFDGLPTVPFAIDAVERAGFDPGFLAVGDGDPGFTGPGGNAEQEGESNRLVDGKGQFERVAERIIGVEADADGDALGAEMDFAGGVGDGGEAVVGGAHPKVGGELGPALVHVGGAAAVVGFEAEDIGIGAIGGPHVIGVDGALDLVDLLVVLVGPHVRREGGGEGVEGDSFEAIAIGGVAGQGQQMLQRIKGLDHGAEFGALNRVATGETLVAGEHAGGLAVVSIENGQHLGGEVEILGFAGQPPAQGLGFQGHAGVHHMLLPGPESAAWGGCGNILALVISAVIEALVLEFAGEVEQPGLAGLFVGVVG